MYFQPEDNRETITAKRGKVLRNYRFKHELKMTFLLIFTRNRGGWNVREKMVGQEVIPGNFMRRYKGSPYDSGVFIY